MRLVSSFTINTSFCSTFFPSHAVIFFLAAVKKHWWPANSRYNKNSVLLRFVTTLICTSTFSCCVALLNVQRRVCSVVHFCPLFLLCSRGNALSSLKVWGSAREAGPALESLLKQLLVKFIKRLWFKSPLASVSISSVLLCFFSLLLCWRLSQCTVLFFKNPFTSSSTPSFAPFFIVLLHLRQTSLPAPANFPQTLLILFYPFFFPLLHLFISLEYNLTISFFSPPDSLVQFSFHWS